MAYHAHTYEISGSRQNNLPVSPMTESLFGHTCPQEQLTELIHPSKNSAKNKQKKKKSMEIAKHFALHANAKMPVSYNISSLTKRVTA